MFNNLVGDEHSIGAALVLSCDVSVRLNKIFANVSNFALTNGDFSVCSFSEFSCSELAERPLQMLSEDDISFSDSIAIHETQKRKEIMNKNLKNQTKVYRNGANRFQLIGNNERKLRKKGRNG